MVLTPLLLASLPVVVFGVVASLMFLVLLVLIVLDIVVSTLVALLPARPYDIRAPSIPPPLLTSLLLEQMAAPLLPFLLLAAIMMLVAPWSYSLLMLFLPIEILVLVRPSLVVPLLIPAALERLLAMLLTALE